MYISRDSHQPLERHFDNELFLWQFGGSRRDFNLMFQTKSAQTWEGSIKTLLNNNNKHHLTCCCRSFCLSNSFKKTINKKPNGIFSSVMQQLKTEFSTSGMLVILNPSRQNPCRLWRAIRPANLFFFGNNLLTTTCALHPLSLSSSSSSSSSTEKWDEYVPI